MTSPMNLPHSKYILHAGGAGETVREREIFAQAFTPQHFLSSIHGFVFCCFSKDLQQNKKHLKTVEVEEEDEILRNGIK